MDMQQCPPCLHMMVMPQHARAVAQYLADLRDAVNEVLNSDAAEPTGMAAVYGMVGSMVDAKGAEPLLVDFMSALFTPER